MLFSLVGCGADAPVQDDSSLPQQEQQDAQNAPSEDADTLSDDDASAPQIDEDGTYTTKDDVALYIHTYGHLPDNFITKKDAQALGWPGGSLEPYAPGKCIGGALHDCLTDLNEPTELIVRGTSALDELLGRRANAFRRVLDDSAEENPNLTVRFEEAVQDSIN